MEGMQTQRPRRWLESNPGPPVTQKLIIVPTQDDLYSPLLSHSCVLGCTVLHYCIVFTSHTNGLRLNSLLTEACARHSKAARSFRNMYSRALALCERDGILIEPGWSGGPSGAFNQNNGEPIMESVHFTGVIWLAITKKQIAMMANKILTEAMPSSMMGWNRCYFIVIERYWQH